MTEYLTIDALAALMGQAKGTILNNRTRNPGAVPPAIRVPGSRILLWRREDVDAFLARFIEPAAAKEPAKRRGRPPKAR